MVEAEEKLIAIAAQTGLTAEAYALSLVQAELSKQNGREQFNGAHDDDYDPAVLARAVARMKNRTPEERAAMRARVMAGTPEPLPIPAGQTIFDVLPRLQGNETEEEVYEALERLS